MARVRILLLFAGLAALALPAPALADMLARGDAAWERRADGHDGEGRAAPGRIDAASSAYRAAVAERPDDLEAHWKLVRALWYAADFAAAGPDDTRERSERAVGAAEAAFAALGRRATVPLRDLEPDAVGSAFPAALHADVAGVYFWSAIAWGVWAQNHGIFSAVRQGVAGRLRSYARAVVALDPGYHRGGALRLLARLHATLPRVPFMTGWVDRSRALPFARRALDRAPDYPGNHMLLALTLLDVAPERRAEALRLLEDVANSEPSQDELVEDLAVRRSARERLAKERAQDG